MYQYKYVSSSIVNDMPKVAYFAIYMHPSVDVSIGRN